MKKQEFRRINLWVTITLYEKIKRNADDAYLKVGTYTRQLVQQALKNNSILNVKCNENRRNNRR